MLITKCGSMKTSAIKVRKSGKRTVEAEKQSLCLFVIVTYRLCSHAQSSREILLIVSVDSNRMFSSEIFLSSILGGFFGGIFIWLLMKILESRQNGLDVPQRVPRDHDERQ